MKNVVLLDDLKEADIRPEKIYDEYKQLLSKDIREYFSETSLLVTIDCPGCSNKNSKFAFKKMGLDYRLCGDCGSLFISPRPTEEALGSFYRKSQSGIFLRKIFLGRTLESRSEKVFSYRIQWITGLTEEYLPDAKAFLDYATKYSIFLKQIKSTGLFDTVISAFPECYEQEDLLSEQIQIFKGNKLTTDSVDIFAAFEVVEKIFDPMKFFKDAHAACRNKGLFIITTTASSGFEYQVLGEHSPNIIPIDRLNLLSLEALTRQIEKAGFEIIEVSTPGRIDVEIVKKAYEKNPDIPLHPFWQYIFRHRDVNAMHSLQEYLQQYQLSSHVRIAAIKR